MEKSIFRLELILQIRQRQKDECAVALGKAVRESQLAREMLNTLKQDLGHFLEAWSDKIRRGDLPAGAAKDCELYRGVMLLRIHASSEKLRNAVSEENKAREQFIEATKKTKVLERLRERFLVRQREAQMKKEQDRLDEHGSNRFSRDQVVKYAN